MASTSPREPGPSGPALPIGAAAARLGVAPETLRSWERRYGLGPRPDRPGAHRRYPPAEMERLERFCRMVGEGVAAPSAAAAVLREAVAVAVAVAEGEAEAATEAVAPIPPPPPPMAPIELAAPVSSRDGSTVRGMVRSAKRLDSEHLLDLLQHAIARDGVVAAWDGTMLPALLAVGRRFTEVGGRIVDVEHNLSWCVSTVLHRVGSAPRPQAAFTPRHVLLACAPDEWHCLALEALRAALAERGAPVCMLGAAVPTGALRRAVRRLDPARVLVWSQVPQTGDPAALPHVPDRARCRVLAVGPGWPASLSAGLSAPATLAEAVEACLV